MYRTGEEKDPDQMLEESLAELKEVRSGLLYDYAEAYESTIAFRRFLNSRMDIFLLMAMLVVPVPVLSALICDSAWILLVIPGVALAGVLCLLSHYPFYRRKLLSDRMYKVGWQLYRDYVEMKDWLAYFKAVFALKSNSGNFISSEDKAYISRQLYELSRKISKRASNFGLLLESRRLSAKLKTHAAYLEEGDIPEAANLLSEGTRVEEAAMAEVSADAETMDLVLKGK